MENRGNAVPRVFALCESRSRRGESIVREVPSARSFNGEESPAIPIVEAHHS